MIRSALPPFGAATADGATETLLASGVDVVSIDRVGSLLDRFGDAFVDRVFSEAEAAYCRSRPDPAQHFAARWAAKEAAVKAVPDVDRHLPLSAFAVERVDARPVLAWDHPAAATAVAELADRTGTRPGSLATSLSLSHDRETGRAVAHVLVTGGAAPAPDREEP